MLSMKKGFMRVISITMVCTMLFAGGCSSPAGNTPSETDNPAQASEAPEPTESALPESTGPANERIGFITQEYNGSNIAEIPYIEYDGETNPEIEAINRSFNQGYQTVYEEFLTNKLDHEWIEIRSYPFTTDDYLQIVTSSCVYPTYGTDGDLSSVNYDRKAKKWLTVEDAMAMMGLNEDSLSAGIGENFIPEAQGELIDMVDIAGFLIHDTPSGKTVELLLNITVENPDAESWQGFYSYMPDENANTNDLTRFSNICLFDPYNMDQMVPPLSYQKNLDAVQPSDEPSNEPNPGPSDELSDEEYGQREMEAQQENSKHLWITVPDIIEDGVLIDSVKNDDGVRSDTYMVDDIVRVVIERLPGIEYGAANVIASTAKWENLPESEIDAQEAELGSYPAFQLAYEKNGNWYMDLYVFTDSWDFRIHTEMPVDIPGMDEDEEYNYVEQTTILWFYTAEIVSEG